MTVLVIIGITLLVTLGMSTLLLWHDVHHQKHSKPVYSKEVYLTVGKVNSRFKTRN